MIKSRAPESPCDWTRGPVGDGLAKESCERVGMSMEVWYDFPHQQLAINMKELIHSRPVNSIQRRTGRQYHEDGPKEPHLFQTYGFSPAPTLVLADLPSRIPEKTTTRRKRKPHYPAIMAPQSLALDLRMLAPVGGSAGVWRRLRPSIGGYHSEKGVAGWMASPGLLIDMSSWAALNKELPPSDDNVSTTSTRPPMDSMY